MKVLLIRFSSVGDLVTLEPAFRAYRYFFKDASITLLTSAIGYGLYHDTDYFNEIIIDKDFFPTVYLLRETTYDVIINLQCTRRSHWLTFFAHKKNLINSSTSMLEKYLYIKAKPKTHPFILNNLGFNHDAIQDYFKENNKAKLPYMLNNYFENSTKKVVALAPGASERWTSKKWGDLNFAEIGKLLLDKNFEVILIGSSLEEESGKIIEAIIPNVKNYIGKTNLSDLKSLLASVDLLIGNDSGPIHIAAGVGTNTLTIFGPISYKYCVKFGDFYLGKHDYIVSDQYDCIPCHKSKCIKNHECMRSISPEMVAEKVENLI